MQCGFNISFYYLDDGQLYIIKTELIPAEIKRVHKDPNWDGKYLLHSFMEAGSTSAPGDVLYSIQDAEDIWNTVKINNLPLKDVLRRSVILEID